MYHKGTDMVEKSILYYTQLCQQAMNHIQLWSHISAFMWYRKIINFSLKHKLLRQDRFHDFQHQYQHQYKFNANWKMKIFILFISVKRHLLNTGTHCVDTSYQEQNDAECTPENLRAGIAVEYKQDSDTAWPTSQSIPLGFLQVTTVAKVGGKWLRLKKTKSGNWHSYLHWLEWSDSIPL